MIYRSMRKAKENIISKHEKEYEKIFDYANEIKRVMPTSTVKVMSETGSPGQDMRIFKLLYVYLGPLKKGFIEGCRPLIGLDGWHLKGPLGGILLTAVSIILNDRMYLVAWAQVEAENNGSWEWFISLLKDYLRMDNPTAYIFICDKQKVCLNAC